VVVYLPVRAARTASVGSGNARAREATSSNGSAVAKSSQSAPTKTSKSSSKSVAREPRGGTPSKKKR
jgi:membrane-bound lytic murein transglycosylase D